MSTVIILLIVALALLGAPLFAIFAGAAMMLFATLENTSITGAAADIFSEKFAESPLLVTIPLFTFAGYLMAESGTPRRLVRVSRAWLGWLPGALPIVCLLASAFFTTFTGGSGITIVAIGGLLYPALIADEYSERFSLGMITTGGSLGLLFPPSLPIVLFAVVAGLEVEKLFLAGIVPGVVSVLAMVAFAVFVGRRAIGLRFSLLEAGVLVSCLAASVVGFVFPDLLAPFHLGRAGVVYVPLGFVAFFSYAAFVQWKAGKLRGPSAVVLALGGPVLYVVYVALRLRGTTDRERERILDQEVMNPAEAAKSLFVVLPELMLPVLLIIALVVGVLRIHEAAAFTALYVFVVEVFVHRDVSFKKDLPRIVEESMTLVGAILAILATAIGFTGFLIQDQLPMKILAAMSEYISGPIMFLLVLNAFLLVVGMLMDIFSAIVVVVPLILPIAREFGMTAENGGLYYLGIVFLLNLEIGYMTPPVGLNLFISSFRFEKPVTMLYRAVLPFIGLLVIALAITTYVPSLALSLVPLDENETEFSLFGEPESAADDDDEPIPDDDGGELDLDALEGEDPLDLDALEDEIDGELDLDALEDELDAEDDLDGELDLDALEDELDAEDAAEDDELDLDALEGELDAEEGAEAAP